MKNAILKRSTTGKVGTVLLGPKHFLNVDILVGEGAACIAREEGVHAQPSIWVIGPLDIIDDLLYRSKEENLLPTDDLTTIWNRIDGLKKRIGSPLQRLSSMINVDIDELTDFCKVAQVSISSPIQGIRDFSSGSPRWIAKQSG